MKPIYRCVENGRVRYVEDPAQCSGSVKPFLSPSRRVALSKLMSALLRHIPWEAGLKLDREGWVGIKELVNGIRNVWRNRELYSWVTEEHVKAVAELDPKGRFEVLNDRIRARYGHSVKVGIRYEIDDSVKTLYHGTTMQAWLRIKYEGIKPGRRLWVHLTGNPQDAYETGRRHGTDVVVLKVSIECLRNRGLRVYRASKSIWLVKEVPPECIEGYSGSSK